MTSDDRSTTARPRGALLDAAVAVVLVGGELVVAPWLGRDAAPTATQVVLTVMTFAVVPLRRDAPRAVLAATTLGAALVVLSTGVENVAVLAPLLALYSVAYEGDRRTTVLAWLATAAVLGGAAAMHLEDRSIVEGVLPVLPWSAAAAAVGDGLRSRRDYVAAVVERAERAEQGREQEARRRVAEERVRIARELHDVVAHHIAVVNVQAGVAQHLLATQPGAAADAIATVRTSATAVLDELGDVLSVLREPGEPGDAAPTPGLARLGALVDSFSPAGLAVEWSLQGQPRDLSPAIDLVAYRLLEEGLTNALKHGTGTARLLVEYGPERLRLHLSNATPPDDRARPAAGNGTGHGLLGMSERTAAVGGAFSAARTSTDTFEVRAELPLRVARR